MLSSLTTFLVNGRTSDSIAADAGDSVKQVYRYIRLNELIPELQKKVDSNTLKFNPAVELSYLTPDEQQSFLDYTTQLLMEKSMPQTASAILCWMKVLTCTGAN